MVHMKPANSAAKGYAPVDLQNAAWGNNFDGLLDGQGEHATVQLS